MEYRNAGKSGLKISAISLGAWITYGGHVEDDTAERTLRTAIDHGINFIDAADVYERGKAERVVGRAIKGYDRHKLVVSTKAFWPMSDDVNDRGLSRKHIIESVNNSLRRFDMDYVDIFFCHRFDPGTPVEETVRAIETLIQQGKVLYWGTSMWTAANLDEGVAAARAIGANLPVVEQPLYNMLDRDVVEGDLEPALERHGVGLVVWSPLAQGVLTGKYNEGIPEAARYNHVDQAWFKQQLEEERIQRVRQLSAVAQDLGVSMAALALAWAMRHPHVSSVITGASRPEQVEENLKALDVTLDAETEARIEGILGNRPANSHRPQPSAA